MIIFNSRGQLGNQLYQWCYLLECSLKYNQLFFFLKSDHKNKHQDYFEIKQLNNKINNTYISIFLYKYILKLNKKVYSIILKLIKLKFKVSQEINEDMWKFPTLQEPSSSNLIYNVDGYFQSLYYFKTNKKLITDSLNIKKEYTAIFYQKYNQLINKELLVVHFRKSDYVSSGSEDLGGMDISLPNKYYHEVFNNIINQDKYKIIFISDASIQKELLEEFNYLQNIEIIEDNEINHFQLMQQASCLVISNSTFAWWAAFLNKKNDKKIYAPKHWIGFKVKKEYPVGIFNNLDWNIIDF